jgi:hypothetical protein
MATAETDTASQQTVIRLCRARAPQELEGTVAVGPNPTSG